MHATYVVRHRHPNENWSSILARSKGEARSSGAYRIPFTECYETRDRYSRMREKVIEIIETHEMTIS